MDDPAADAAERPWALQPAAAHHDQRGACRDGLRDYQSARIAGLDSQLVVAFHQFPQPLPLALDGLATAAGLQASRMHKDRLRPPLPGDPPRQQHKLLGARMSVARDEQRAIAVPRRRWRTGD
jgi:hypothetical protein